MKKRTLWILGLTVAFAMLMFLAGCGDQDNEEATEIKDAVEQTLDEEAGAGAINIRVIAHINMGEEWIEQLNSGVQKQAESTKDGSKAVMAIIETSTVASQVDLAVSEEYDGIIVAADFDDEETAEAIDKAREAGVPVVSFNDNRSNGYNTAAPVDLGKSMAKTLIAQIALGRGIEEWGDEKDFSIQMANAVQGIWSTANSSGDQKQFVAPYVMEFAKNDDGKSELGRVSLLSEIRQTPDEKGYSYVLNTGNYYYLFPETPSKLECHWDPDGYSESDSLTKAADSVGEDGDGNSSFVIDMNSYKDTEEYVTGTISTFEGYNSKGESEKCEAVNLNTPLRIVLKDGRDVLINAIQLNADDLSSYVGSDKAVKVKGKLFEAHTDHHFTPVIMNVTGIE